jgi:3-oxoacyl-[acyl-carrier protein] reductase
MSEFAGKVALVTGASRGIGSAIADRLVGDGMLVVGTATSAVGAEQINTRLVGLGQGAGRALDVNDADAVTALIKEITSTWGAPTILVNNAGITRDQLLMRMKENDWEDVIDTDLRSVFRLSKACLRGMMKARDGRIVNISSVIGSTGNAGQSNYAAAKAGMIGFSKSLAREIGSRGITVNVVAPGFIETDMTDKLPEQQKLEMLGQIPLAKLGSVDDIADAVSWLVSPGAAYVTGHTLHVNGGMFME